MKLRCWDKTRTPKALDIDVENFSVSQLEDLLKRVKDNEQKVLDYNLKVQFVLNEFEKFKEKAKPIETKKAKIQAEYNRIKSGLKAHEFGATMGMFSLTKIIYREYYDLEEKTGGIGWYKSSAKPITDILDALVEEYEKYRSLYDDLYNSMVPPPVKKPYFPNVEFKLVNKKIIIASSEMTADLIIRAIEEKNKSQLVLAKASAYDGTQRQLANSIKIDIRNQIHALSLCPYCGKSLSIDGAHADHIYPVSKGGLSTTRNMVYICAGCNLKKKDMTLRNFIKKYNLNADNIHHHLDILGKDF